MKKTLLLASIAWALMPCRVAALSAIAPDTFQPPKYKLRLEFMSEKKPTYSGYLAGLKDTAVAVCGLNQRKPTTRQEIPVGEIRELKFRDPHSIGSGMKVGATAGFVAGFVYGMLRGSNSSDRVGPYTVRISPLARGLVHGLLGAGAGLVIGGAVGVLRIRIPIDGKQEKYEKQKEMLQRYRWEMPANMR